MSRQLAPTKKPTFEDVRRQFQAWRKVRKLHEPIPVELWKAAASLCDGQRTYKIAKELGLNYTKLKEHVHASKTDFPVEQGSLAAFVEVDLGVPAIARQCIIEMRDPNGRTMTLQLHGDACPDALLICKAFWGED